MPSLLLIWLALCANLLHSTIAEDGWIDAKPKICVGSSVGKGKSLLSCYAPEPCFTNDIFTMSTENTTPSHGQAARALLKQLQTEFPVMRDALPLAIGIDKQLMTRLPDVSRKVLRTALGIHTNSMRYLKVMKNATERFDLDGKAAGEVTEEQRTHAATALEERLKREAEQQKARRQAQLAQKKAEEDARRRDDKLQQLAAKFARGR